MKDSVFEIYVYPEAAYVPLHGILSTLLVLLKMIDQLLIGKLWIGSIFILVGRKFVQYLGGKLRTQFQ